MAAAKGMALASYLRLTFRKIDITGFNYCKYVKYPLISFIPCSAVTMWDFRYQFMSHWPSSFFKIHNMDMINLKNNAMFIIDPIYCSYSLLM
jgi:hypothetical protein